MEHTILKLPNPVYKYRDWNSPDHKRVLTHQEIYFAPPLKCDEQHECNLPMDFDTLTNDMIVEWYYRSEFNPGKTDAERRRVAEQMAANGSFRNPRHQAETHEKFRQRLNRDLSIFCVSPFRDNLHLWEVFADSNTGFCVGLNVEELLKMDDFGSGSEVSYYPTGNPFTIPAITFSDEEKIGSMFKVIYSLPDIYQDEKEYRFSKMLIKNKRVAIAKSCFSEVILGSAMPEKAKEEIKSIIVEHLPGCKVFESSCDFRAEMFAFTQIA